jgi:predicted nucleic acid-binding protein
VIWIDHDEAMLLEAAALKTKHPLSIADAWIAACANLSNAVLVHKDPEFRQLALAQEMLPLKSLRKKSAKKPQAR